MSRSLLSEARFGGRRHLGAIARDHRPSQAIGSVGDSLHAQLRQRWASMLAVDADNLLLCATRNEAVQLLSRCVLAPGDVAIFGRPGPVEISASVLAAGASFVDLGRLVSGRLDPAAAQRALKEHPEAIGWALAPAWGGGDDVAALGSGWRAVLADASLAESLHGDASAVGQGADAVVVALRDPDQPALPRMWGVVAAAGQGGALGAVAGPSSLHPQWLRAALAAADTLSSAPGHHTERWQRALRGRKEMLARAVSELDAVQLIAGAGTAAVLRCLDGQAVGPTRALQRLGWRAIGYGAQPMAGAILIDLA